MFAFLCSNHVVHYVNFSILVGEASSLVSRRKHEAHPSNAIGGDVSVAVMVKTVCKLLCSPSVSGSILFPPASQPVIAAAAASKGRRNRHSRVIGMSESEVSDAGGGSSVGGPVDAATTIDGKSRLHLLTCLLHLVRLAPRAIQPHWLQVLPTFPFILFIDTFTHRSPTFSSLVTAGLAPVLIPLPPTGCFAL
jgi:hypothetical protein